MASSSLTLRWRKTVVKRIENTRFETTIRVGKKNDADLFLDDETKIIAHRLVSLKTMIDSTQTAHVNDGARA
jgi:hypothetical protein